MTNLAVILALVPFIVFLTCLLGIKTTLLKASVMTLITTSILASLYWRVFPQTIYLSYIKGVLIALDILLIIWGALFFLHVLQRLNVITNISVYLESFSKDYRIQVIVLAWFLENFIEGTAGFGTPAMIVAPLLIGLGLGPLEAVIITLLGNSTSVVFGAAGTPIRVGFAGLDSASIPILAASFNFVGIIVPVFMLWLLVSRQSDRWQLFREALPFAIWSGIAFVVPSLLVVPLGQEFPSILGAIIGLGLVFTTTKMGIFIPKNIRRSPSYTPVKPTMRPLPTFLPYILLIVLLVVGKFALANAKFIIPLGINYSFNLFNPGWAFLIVGLFYAFKSTPTKNLIGKNLASSFHQSIVPFLVIVSMSSIAQIMLSSGNNLSGLPTMTDLIAIIFETNWLPFWAPFLGAFGSFLTGSATISNIMFGGLLASTANALAISVPKILALTVVGAAAGNMIALADILAAETVAGLKHQERAVLRGVILPCLTCVILAGLLGMIFI